MHVYVYRYVIHSTNQSTLKLPVGFWALELNFMVDDEDSHYLTYKKERSPPYPLVIPKGASFHCTNATYCVERSSGDLSRCNDTHPRVTIRGLQV